MSIESVGSSFTLRWACTFTAVVACVVVSPGAAAQTTAAKQITAASVKPLPLYAQPGDATPAKTVAPDGLPWPILEEKQDFFRVKWEGVDYWVDGMQVRAARGVNAKCTVTSKAQVPVGATAGAGENACAK